MSFSPPPADLSAYEPPQSLWKIVENNVPDHEREEVKNMLGESLVEQSLELHEEIGTLIEIWRDYREETNQVTQPPKRLPEPPAVRDRLRQEICFFVNRIREKSSQLGSDPEHVLAKHNSEVLDYVMEIKRPESGGYFSRPSTARSSRDGRETPMCRLGTPTSDRFSSTSLLSEEVEEMHDKLNILKIDEVTTHLRQTLQEEIEHLLVDISFLQGCLEDEADFRTQSSMGMIDQEPTLTELREERNMLEKDLLKSESPVPKVLREKTANSSRHGITRQRSNPKLAPLERGLSPSSRTLASTMPRPPDKSPGSAGRSRPGPMKASHQITTTQPLQHPDSETKKALPRSAVRRPRSTDRENRLEGPVEPVTHLTVRAGSGSVPRSSRLVKVASVPASAIGLSGKEARPMMNPAPPTDSRPSSRPSSASRFRRMVHGCRDQEEAPPVGGAS